MNDKRRSPTARDHFFTVLIVTLLLVNGFFVIYMLTYVAENKNLLQENPEYPVRETVVVTCSYSNSTVGNATMIAYVHLSANSPVPNTIIATEEVQMQVDGILSAAGTFRNSTVVSAFMNGALSWPLESYPSFSHPNGAYLTTVASYNGIFHTDSVPIYFPDSGSYPAEVTPAAFPCNTNLESSAEVEPVTLIQQSSINHTNLLLTIAIFFFELVSSLVLVGSIYKQSSLQKILSTIPIEETDP